jgi:uncharacterized protein (DUF1499 family)
MVPNYDLEKIVEAMKDPKSGVEVKNRTVWLTNYKSCFSASDAIDWLIKVAGEARTREEAVEKGQEMVQRFMISHVTGSSTFADEKSLYFYFVPHEFSEIAMAMLDWETGVSIQTRQYKLWTYSSCFIGSEGAAWIRNRYNITQEEALTIGRTLVKYNIIAHVAGKHDFKDEYLFYTFPVLKLHCHPDAPPTCMNDIRQGRLAPPHITPNCISTQADASDTVHLSKVGPLIIPNGMNAEQAKFIIKSIMCDFDSTLQNEHDFFLHYIVKVGKLNWTDDIEFLVSPETNQVHYRSASRVGYGDMGANNKRILKIFDTWKTKIANEFNKS